MNVAPFLSNTQMSPFVTVFAELTLMWGDKLNLAWLNVEEERVWAQYTLAQERTYFHLTINQWAQETSKTTESAQTMHTDLLSLILFS